MSGQFAENDAPVEREHNDGCLTETTWDEGDCNCRCSVCGNRLPCRWAPGSRVTPPDSPAPAVPELLAGDACSCLSCDEPAVDSGEGRYCGTCFDYEGTCVNDHCLTCGSST